MSVTLAGMQLRGVSKVEIVRDTKNRTVDVKVYGKYPWDYQNIILWGIWDGDKSIPPQIVIDESATPMQENQAA
jgi:hypothetical protein